MVGWVSDLQNFSSSLRVLQYRKCSYTGSKCGMSSLLLAGQGTVLWDLCGFVPWPCNLLDWIRQLAGREGSCMGGGVEPHFSLSASSRFTGSAAGSFPSRAEFRVQAAGFRSFRCERGPLTKCSFWSAVVFTWRQGGRLSHRMWALAGCAPCVLRTLCSLRSPSKQRILPNSLLPLPSDSGNLARRASSGLGSPKWHALLIDGTFCASAGVVGSCHACNQEVKLYKHPTSGSWTA